MIRALRVLRGLSELPPWINFFATFWCYIQKNVYLCTQQGKWWPEGHSEKPLKKGFIWCQSIAIWLHHHSRWSPTTPSNRKRKWRRIALSLFFYRRRKPRYDNHRFPKGIHVTGTDTPSGPGIEELSCGERKIRWILKKCLLIWWTLLFLERK